MMVLLLALLSSVVDLPGGPPVGMDYLAYDRDTNRVWVPAGNTGNVDVIDVATRKISVIPGFATAPARKPGRPPMGPSSAATGEGVVWIGNRGDNRVSSYDVKSLAPVAVIQLPAMPDGLAYVGVTHEIWVTVPARHALMIIDAREKKPSIVKTIEVEGQPEGYAVDGARHLFYTNLEDKDRTLTVDVKTRRVIADWPAGCGAEGPRGLALDTTRRWLFVACSDGARVLDVAHGGKVLGAITTDAGVDNLDYDARRQHLLIASARAGTMAVTRIGTVGTIEKVATVTTAPGARNPILDARGTAYVEDTLQGRLLVFDVGASAF